MGAPNAVDRLRSDLLEALTDPLVELGLDLEDVTVSQAGKRRLLRVAVDRDGGVGMDAIADATRAVSRVLDETDLMGERAFTLEVSSPGVERPLTQPRHWRRNTGRLVKVGLRDGGSVTGRVRQADDSAATLEVDGEPRTIGYAEVTKARVQIEFGPRD